MSSDAVIMLVLAILIVWGGLAASIVALSRHPDVPDDHTP